MSHGLFSIIACMHGLDMEMDKESELLVPFIINIIIYILAHKIIHEFAEEIFDTLSFFLSLYGEKNVILEISKQSEKRRTNHRLCRLREEKTNLYTAFKAKAHGAQATIIMINHHWTDEWPHADKFLLNIKYCTTLNTLPIYKATQIYIDSRLRQPYSYLYLYIYECARWHTNNNKYW